MKKILYIFTFCLLVQFASAQKSFDINQQSKSRVTAIEKAIVKNDVSLRLTDAQKVKLEKIYTEISKELAVYVNQDQFDKAAFKKLSDDLNNKYYPNITSILDPKQLLAYKTYFNISDK